MIDLSASYGVPPTTFTLAFQACEVLTIHNALSSYTFPEMSVLLNGHTIRVKHGDGNEPDTFFIIPAKGFWASEDAVVIEENASATIEICSEGLA